MTLFLLTTENGNIGNHENHSFLSSEMGATPIPDTKNTDYNVLLSWWAPFVRSDSFNDYRMDCVHLNECAHMG